MYPEPSLNDHDAPWNLDDEGNCECSHCMKERRKKNWDEYNDDDLNKEMDYAKERQR